MARYLTRKEAGEKGEDAVADYLKRRGHKIITQNYRTYGGELDIVSIKRRELVFTEVKVKQTAYYGPPEQELTYRKMQAVRTAARRFIKDECMFGKVPYYTPKGHRRPKRYKKYRFDFAGVLLSGNTQQIRYTKNAF